MGRVLKQSNPTETNDSWVPYGDDAAGWLYTQQTYDWKGRPLITTNTDTTTKEISYSGCGCAGGEVVTLTDEGTIDGGTPKRRQQKIYSDVFDRTAKTEVLNWQGGTVYATAVITYNQCDQLMQVRQYAGTESSGNYQDTTMTYDGYGRLKTKHVPEQQVDPSNSSSTDHTTWDYNSDDTIHTVTDARGASAIYTYNGRHQVTVLSYPPTPGITQTSTISLSYDAAGNRTGMSDGSGNVSYSYDRFSHLISETRQINGLSGSYTISYEYGLAGQLTRITNPFNDSIYYGYDQAGRLTSVTGSPYGGWPLPPTTQYASGLQYRAWDGLKGITYGNNPLTLSATYNSRLQVASSQISGQDPQLGPPIPKRATYQYNADGSLRYVHDLINDMFDRGVAYDHVGRVKEAYSGSEAAAFNNNEPPPSSFTGPYRQSFQFSAWGDMTNFADRYWSMTYEPITKTYLNKRNQDPAWQYDAEGNLLHDDKITLNYDAAGLSTFNGSLTYDGDGQEVKRTRVNITHYYIRSSVLGGNIVSELNSTTEPAQSYVYAGANLLAIQGHWYDSYHVVWQQIVYWNHQDPITGSSGNSNPWGGYGATVELDELGVNVGTEDPFLNPPYDPSTDSPYPSVSTGNGYDIECYEDNMTINCEQVQALIEAGAAAPCPDNSCGPIRVVYQGQEVWGFFNAFGDGYSGYVPSNAEYAGNGTVAPLGSRGSRDRPSLGQRGGRPSTRGDTDLGRLNGAIHPEEDLRRTSSTFFNHPQNTLQEVIREKAQTAASQKLIDNEDCRKFMQRLINETRGSMIVSLPGGPAASAWYGLNAYSANAVAGNISASGKSGKGGDWTTWGVTTNGSISWNKEFYDLSQSDAALQILHESLHLIPGFSDQALARAASIISDPNRAKSFALDDKGRNAASQYLNDQIKNHCQ